MGFDFGNSAGKAQIESVESPRQRIRSACTRYKSPLVYGKAGEKLSAVEIILREEGSQSPGAISVAVLRKSAALINLGQKSPRETIVGDVALDVGQLRQRRPPTEIP